MTAVVENKSEEWVLEKHEKDEAAVAANNDEAAAISDLNTTPEAAGDSSNNPTASQTSQQAPQAPEKRGLFGRIFRRTKQEPTIVNGEADLLDDSRPEPDEEANKSSTEDEGEEMEKSESEGENSDSEEGEGETSDGELDTADDESSDGEDAQQQDTQQSTAENFADFRQGRKYAEEGEDDETAEFTSLIGSSGARNDTTVAVDCQDKNNNRRKGGFLGCIFRKKSQEQRGAGEAKGLLGNEDEDSVEEQFLPTTSYRENGNYEENDGPQRRGSQSESSEHDDDNEDDSDSDENSILDSGNDSYDQTYSFETPGNQELHGRIQGYGNESASHGNGSFTVDGSARFYDTMADDSRISSSNRGYDPDMVKKGPLAGVGNIVQNIFRNKRGFDSEDERRRMVAYIDELQWKLRQKDNEIQSWKARAEHLEKEMKRLRGEDESDEDDDEEASDCWFKGGEEEEEEDAASKESEEDYDKIENDGAQYGLLVMDESETQTDAEESQNKEGTLIDMTAEKPVFDPLASRTENNTHQSTSKTDDEFLDGYQSAESTLEKDNDEDLFEAFRSASQVEDDSNQEEPKSEPAKADTETASDIYEDALDENSTSGTLEEEGDKPKNDDGSETISEKDRVEDAQYKFLSAISTSLETPERNVAKVPVVTPT